ncbi:MAG: DUF1800 domain-containing protein [Burkholderiales bacterium]|nr:DUF1800 domain-containing protein [Burkholderiales bacterium]
MPSTNQHPTSLQRRHTLQSLAAWGGTVLLPGAWAQTSAGPTVMPGTDAQWRAISRVGYGPTPNLVRAVQGASSPKDWALQHIDAAYVASQSAPRMAPDLADINAPLPQIFAGARHEREVRAAIKAGAVPGEPPDNRRMDFSGPPDPLYFNRSMVQKAAAWRLLSASQPDEENPLLARMTEFWFNHLNIYAGKGAVRPFTGHYVINVARAHALGKFEDLLLASAHHPAMLLYLDQAQSVAPGLRGGQGNTRGLNENYARELMELHTLGVQGGYSQADVRDLARVLTGWTVDPRDAGGFRFATRLHDTGDKRVMGRRYPDGLFGTGEREGEQAIRWLARQPQTAQRISLRLAQFFVSDTPPPAVVTRLSQTFLASQGDMRAVLRTLFESPEFWQPENRLFKTPMDFACSALAAVQGAERSAQHADTDRRHLVLTAGFLAQAGQPIHGWQTPDGYKTDAATWLAPEALTRRADYALALARQAGDMDFLQPYLSETTRATIAQEKPALRAGLMLASPDFMRK